MQLYLLKKKNPNIEAFVVNVTSGRNQTLKDDLYYAKMASKELGVDYTVTVHKDDIQEHLKAYMQLKLKSGHRYQRLLNYFVLGNS